MPRQYATPAEINRGIGSPFSQQAPAFSPFMRQLVVFTGVAMSACKHDVTDIIGTTASERYYMVSVILCQLVMAVVALALLPLNLSLNILGSMLASSLTPTSAVISEIGIQFLFMGSSTYLPSLYPFNLVSLIVCSMPLCYLLLVRRMVGSCTRFHALSMPLIKTLVLLSNALSVLKASAISTLIYLISVLSPIVSTLRVEAILAARAQTILGSSICMEVVSCSREHFTALGTAFLRYTIHWASLSNRLVSWLSDVPSILSLNNVCLNYSITPPQKQVYRGICYA